MKPHPPPHRIRKTIKWGGAVVTVLLMVVWVGSSLYTVCWSGARGKLEIDVARGSIHIQYFLGEAYRPSLGWICGWNQQTLLWKPRWFRQVARHMTPPAHSETLNWELTVPWWMPFAAAAALTAVAWRMDILARSHPKLNLCPKCNYDRTGLAIDAKCPECGSGGTPA